MSGYAHPESLASTQWVADHSDDTQVRVVEVIWGTRAGYGLPTYQESHIPGAIAWDFGDDLKDATGNDILDQSGMEALFSRSGITPEMSIVVYSGNNNILGTYTFWLLKIHGHKDVRLLDGGRQKWLDEKRPTTSEVPDVTPSVYQGHEPNWGLRASKDDVRQLIGKENSLLIDTRTTEMYQGLNKARAARAGRIPGAISLPAQQDTDEDGSHKGWLIPTVQSDGTFKSAQELQALSEKLSIDPDKEIVTYCVGGGLSTHAWFVLTQLLGYDNVREYDRSWAEWGNLEDFPVET